MSKFDVADAALAGFGVIRRKPLAVLVWGLVIYVLAVLPAIGLIGVLINLVHDLKDHVKGLDAGGGPASAAMNVHDVLGMEASVLFSHPWASVGSLLVRVLLAAAVIRAVAAPKDDRFFYLRFGRGELMLVLVTFVAAILLVLAICAYVGVFVGLGFAVSHVSKGLVAVVAIVGGLGYIVGLIILLLRFSLIAPASVIEQKFRLFESWRLTRGQAGSLFLVAVLNFIVVLLVQSALSALIFGIGGVAVVASGGGHIDPAAIEAFMNQPAQAITQQLLPWILGLGLIASMIGSVFITIALAPWAYAYKALTEPVQG